MLTARFIDAKSRGIADLYLVTSRGALTEVNYIAYIFAFVPERVRTTEAFLAIPSVRLQLKAIGKRPGRIGLEKDVTTYRGASFVNQPGFRKAITMARQDGAAVLFADLGSLLAKTKSKAFAACVKFLDETDVVILDHTTGKAWSQLDEAARRVVEMRVIERKVTRRHKDPDKGSVQSPSTQEDGRPVQGSKAQRKGAAVNRARANSLAAEAEPILANLEKALTAGGAIKPSQFQKALEDANIKPTRATKWSINAVKNLLDRVRELRQAKSDV